MLLTENEKRLVGILIVGVGALIALIEWFTPASIVIGVIVALLGLYQIPEIRIYAKVKREQNKQVIKVRDSTDSIVVGHARDVTQNIYHGTPPEKPKEKSQLPPKEDKVSVFRHKEKGKWFVQVENQIQIEVERIIHPREALARHISPLTVEKRWTEHSVEPDGKRLYAEHITGVQLADRQVDSEPLKRHIPNMQLQMPNTSRA